MKLNQQGITLVEILVVITLIALLSGVAVSNFPRIKIQLGLTRAAHMFSQDLKNARDLGGSGHIINLPEGGSLLPKGYGVFIDTELLGDKTYIFYADVNGNNQYEAQNDYIIKEVNLQQDEPGIIIKQIRNASSRLSVNFSPPNFKTDISNLLSGYDGVEIVLSAELYDDLQRIIYVNKSGLIENRP